MSIASAPCALNRKQKEDFSSLVLLLREIADFVNLEISRVSFSGSVHGAKSYYMPAFLANIDIMFSNLPPKLDVFYIFFIQVIIALRTFHSFMCRKPSPL
jgi:hypothetical protein